MQQKLYFEDLQIGQTFLSPGRTITEADLTIFSMVSGDWHPMHSDSHYAERTSFGERIVHGPLGIAIVLGMFGRFGGFDETAIALLDIRDWKFAHPIRVGDTLSVEMRIASKRLTSDMKRGVVDRAIRLLRHDGVALQHGNTAMMMLSKLG